MGFLGVFGAQNSAGGGDGFGPVAGLVHRRDQPCGDAVGKLGVFPQGQHLDTLGGPVVLGASRAVENTRQRLSVE